MDTRSVGLSDDLALFPAIGNRRISSKDILLFVTQTFNVQVQRPFGDFVLSGNLFALDFNLAPSSCLLIKLICNANIPSAEISCQNTFSFKTKLMPNKSSNSKYTAKNLHYHSVSFRFQLKNRFLLKGEQTLVPSYNYIVRVKSVSCLTEPDVARVCIRLSDIGCSPKEHPNSLKIELKSMKYGQPICAVSQPNRKFA